MKRFFLFALIAFVLGWRLGRRAERRELKLKEISNVPLKAILANLDILEAQGLIIRNKPMSHKSLAEMPGGGEKT